MTFTIVNQTNKKLFVSAHVDSVDVNFTHWIRVISLYVCLYCLVVQRHDFVRSIKF